MDDPYRLPAIDPQEGPELGEDAWDGWDEPTHPADDEPAPNPLAEVDLAWFFGPNGPLARHLEGYELRPSQLTMAQAVKEALLKRETALIEAPTGTGKSIAYLLPAVLSEKTVVVATANKSLQSQLFTKDIPFLSRVLARPIDAVLVKGRSNYVCTYKWEQESAQQRLFAEYDREHEQIALMRRWLDETESGDVDELPFMLDGDLRPRLVSFTDDCLQRDCPYFEDGCFVNQMRDRAAQAQVLVTNHHLMLNALELGFAGERILPPASVYVVDEAHQLEETATAVFEISLTDHTVEQLLRRSAIQEHASPDELDELRMQNTVAFQEISFLSRDNSFPIQQDLEEMKRLGLRLRDLWEGMKQADPYGLESRDSPEAPSPDQEEAAERGAFAVTLSTLGSTAEKVLAVASSRQDGSVVRYANRLFDRRHVTLEVHAAPLEPGNLLQDYLFHEEERSVICTSATLATDGHFAHFRQRCGVGQAGIECLVPAVFDYPRQALLYQPALPAYDWRNKDAFYEQAGIETRRLLEASRGRALCLFTSWSGLQSVKEFLCRAGAETVWPLRAQGDAPRDALLGWFRETPYSVLLATKSFWEGVDIPGDDLSLVVLDKLPFPTPGDPLHSARMRVLDGAPQEETDDRGRQAGGSRSFGQYMVPLMTLALKQGFGRLIRRTSDRGVVAILDDRLSTKAYGRRARADLPPAQFTRRFEEVHRFYREALDSPADFALNVTADSAAWQWELVRLQDGRTDRHRGSWSGPADPDRAALAAVGSGLENLAQRVRGAGRHPREFGVELRCAPGVAALLDAQEPADGTVRAVVAARRLWKSVPIRLLAESPTQLLPDTIES